MGCMTEPSARLQEEVPGNGRGDHEVGGRQGRQTITAHEDHQETEADQQHGHDVNGPVVHLHFDDRGRVALGHPNEERLVEPIEAGWRYGLVITRAQIMCCYTMNQSPRWPWFVYICRKN